MLLRRANIGEEVTFSFSFINRIYVQKKQREQQLDEEFQVF